MAGRSHFLSPETNSVVGAQGGASVSTSASARGAPEPLLFAHLAHDLALTPYRPSNRTEGDIFHARWCAVCEAARPCREDPDASPCMIAVHAEAFAIDDPSYPKEWIIDARGPRCTAFAVEAQP